MLTQMLSTSPRSRSRVADLRCTEGSLDRAPADRRAQGTPLAAQELCGGCPCRGDFLGGREEAGLDRPWERRTPDLVLRLEREMKPARCSTRTQIQGRSPRCGEPSAGKNTAVSRPLAVREASRRKDVLGDCDGEEICKVTAEAVRIWLSCTEMRELIQDLRMANTIVQTFGCCEAVQVVRDPRHGI